MILLAVDPGNFKCGLAVVNQEAGVLTKMITPLENFRETVNNLHRDYRFTVVVVGDRTNSKAIRDMLAFLKLPVVTVDENRSSVEGRYRYLKDNTKGLARFIPVGLRVPKKPYDDYVAVILAERFLKTGPLP
ncbi:MAG: pre-16S rRNA-processing nuclease YqgF [Bacillota bacterium]